MYFWCRDGSWGRDSGLKWQKFGCFSGVEGWVFAKSGVGNLFLLIFYFRWSLRREILNFSDFLARDVPVGASMWVRFERILSNCRINVATSLLV